MSSALLQFTKLRIAGFKSFVDPAELLIEPGLTGVVGPNGCGKSNLIEALRWVMGETSARQMRGGEMDDVIFAGSADRAGRNVAEVVIELDNANRVAPPPYADDNEIVVSRKIERAKGSLYRINGREVRARDVHLLFADAASGARSSALVTQGQVSQLIAAKPAERRVLIEEAAGIVGLHARRHEAELRLQSAETNLRRLDDVLSTLAVQHQQLKKQTRQATHYRTLSSQIRQLDATILWMKWRRAEDALTTARARLIAAERSLSTATGACAQASTQRSALAASVPSLRDAVMESAAVSQRLSVNAERLDGEEQQAARDEAAIQTRLQQFQADLDREVTLANDATATLGRLTDEKERLITACRGEDALRAAAQAPLTAMSAQVTALEAEVARLTEHLAAIRAQHGAVQRSRDEASALLRRLAVRQQDVRQQRAAASANLDALPSAELTQAAIAAAEAVEVVVREAAMEADELRIRAASAEPPAAAALRVAETALTHLAAEEVAIAELLAADPSSVEGAVLDAIVVDDGLATALAAALGDDLFASENDDAPTRWRTLPHSVDPPLPSGAAPLAPLLTAPPALARRLAQIGIVETDSDGNRLQPDLSPGQRLASREGGLWRWDGYIRSATAATPASVRLHQRARLDALAPKRAEAEVVRDAARDHHDAVRHAASEAATTERQLQAQLKYAEQDLSRARQAHAETLARRARIEQQLTALTDVTADLDADYDEVAARLQALQDELAELARGDDNSPRLEAMRANLAARRAEQMQQQTRVDTLARDAAGRVRRLQAIDQDIASWSGRLAGMQRQIEAIIERRQQAQTELTYVADLPEVFARRRHLLLEQMAEADTARHEAVDRLAVAETALAEADLALRSNEKVLADAREERARAEAQIDQGDQLAASLLQAIVDRLGVRPNELKTLVADADGFSLAEEERRLDRMRRERDLMGPVNLRAEEESNALVAQISDLERQHADLTEAIGKLRRGVAELDKEARERLRASFVEVDRHFQMLFHRLFGGGRAYLTLSDSDDPLAAGIEIMASPPGKKLQLMSLLSGGEQTLTALALRFALFLSRPAPICVLDEVDAPLDDANVDRLCTLLSDLATSGTRFLVITHHRLTMARMDRLFGVTMPERGASHLVSVDLMRAEVLRQTA
ncbi:MAG: AAA family ATPase [Rhodospirillales bacterium]|nr:AAA family ATPase [Rhodospirillales bacterium]